MLFALVSRAKLKSSMEHGAPQWSRQPSACRAVLTPNAVRARGCLFSHVGGNKAAGATRKLAACVKPAFRPSALPPAAGQAQGWKGAWR